MNDMIEIITFVATAVWHVWPYFLISIFFAVLINQLNLSSAIRRAFDNRIGIAIVAATAVGAFSPFCSCTVIPVVAGLLASGVPLAPIMSFWIASPTMDPEIFALTAGILGMPLAMVRMVATLLLSLGAGVLTWALLKTPLLNHKAVEKNAVKVAVSEPSCCNTQPVPNTQPAFAFSSGAIQLDMVTAVSPVPTCTSTSCSVSATQSAQPANWRSQLRQSVQAIHWPTFGKEMAEQSWKIGRWLLVAFILEALITLYVPQDAIANLLGAQNRWAVPLAALIGVPLYLSNMSALPIVNGLLMQGMQPGAAIAFLIAGPVTTIPAMTVVWGIVSRRIFVLYLAIGLFGAMLLGFLANMVL
ncbi:MAG: permease [Anaerolineae bacterium]|nr:permease [Anaerolineae bacterium]